MKKEKEDIEMVKEFLKENKSELISILVITVFATLIGIMIG